MKTDINRDAIRECTSMIGLGAIDETLVSLRAQDHKVEKSRLNDLAIQTLFRQCSSEYYRNEQFLIMLLGKEFSIPS